MVYGWCPNFRDPSGGSIESCPMRSNEGKRTQILTEPAVTKHPVKGGACSTSATCEVMFQLVPSAPALFKVRWVMFNSCGHFFCWLKLIGVHFFNRVLEEFYWFNTTHPFWASLLNVWECKLGFREQLSGTPILPADFPFNQPGEHNVYVSIPLSCFQRSEYNAYKILQVKSTNFHGKNM